MSNRFRTLCVLSCVLLAASAGALAQDAPFDDPLLRNAAQAPAELAAHWTLSSAELPAGACAAGNLTPEGLCRVGGRVAPPDDVVFQFAAAQAGAEAAAGAAAPIVTPRAGAAARNAPVPAGIGSVPEPQSYALLCGGLGLLGALARRRPRGA